jgi:hypothetical protein
VHFKNNRPLNWNSLKFTEKLKIYGKSLGENESKYADKLNVKNIIKKMNIDELNIPKTIAVLDINNTNLNLDKLPDTCIIKSSHGWNDLIILKNKKITDFLSISNRSLIFNANIKSKISKNSINI